jgi:hypothetical protein
MLLVIIKFIVGMVLIYQYYQVQAHSKHSLHSKNFAASMSVADPANPNFL